MNEKKVFLKSIVFVFFFQNEHLTDLGYVKVEEALLV